MEKFSSARLNDLDFSKSRFLKGARMGDLVIEIIRMEFHRRGGAQAEQVCLTLN